ncbi:TIGR04222 domain-containing membrane protein [Micromonospora fluostatini]|uniref:TIGR04222 domain-containing membrane protein n=1 Tax=Micromonospora sp. JCM 30529 TaxID=3421643 RepID=UPI003D18243C
MIVIAASGDTWGISGPVFLGIYLTAVAVVAVGAAVDRARILAGPTGRPDHLDAQQVAYLAGGAQRALWAALSGLRASGIVGVSPDRRLAASGSLPAGGTPLDVAVHRAAYRRRTARELHLDAEVGAALTTLRDTLRQRGLLLTPAQRQRLRTGGIVLFGLEALGWIRVVAGLTNDRPVGFLIASLILTAVLAVVFFLAPRQTQAARAALRAQRRQHAHLTPTAAPAYATYGAAGAAMGVALFGTASLWAFDPAFAEQAEIQRQSAAGSTGGGATGGGDGGGSGGDGGGGCGGGGGGCGGGCGG